VQLISSGENIIMSVQKSETSRLWGQARALVRQGDIEEANKIYGQLIEKFESGTEQNKEAGLLFYSEAIGNKFKLIQGSPDKNKLLEEVLGLANKLVMLNPDKYQGYFYQALAQRQLGQYREVSESLEKLGSIIATYRFPQALQREVQGTQVLQQVAQLHYELANHYFSEDNNGLSRPRLAEKHCQQGLNSVDKLEKLEDYLKRKKTALPEKVQKLKDDLQSLGKTIQNRLSTQSRTVEGSLNSRESKKNILGQSREMYAKTDFKLMRGLRNLSLLSKDNKSNESVGQSKPSVDQSSTTSSKADSKLGKINFSFWKSKKGSGASVTQDSNLGAGINSSNNFVPLVSVVASAPDNAIPTESKKLSFNNDTIHALYLLYKAHLNYSGEDEATAKTQARKELTDAIKQALMKDKTIQVADLGELYAQIPVAEKNLIKSDIDQSVENGSVSTLTS
jgi:hypothetical protein